MPKNKGMQEKKCSLKIIISIHCFFFEGKGGKNYKKGKKRDEGETRRELEFKEDGQGD